MSEAFDPYYQWLGIPQNEQPPNHYRLLGLAIYEANPDVIANSADRQMAHIRNHQSGRYGEASQTLLNEIAAAKLCLLKPDQKSAYDAQLRSQGSADDHTARSVTVQSLPASNGSPTQTASPWVASPTSAMAQPAPARNPSPQLDEGELSIEGRLAPLMIAGAGGVVAMLLLVAGVGVWYLRSEPPATPPLAITPDRVAPPTVDDALTPPVADLSPSNEQSAPRQPPSSDAPRPSRVATSNGHAPDIVNPTAPPPVSPKTPGPAGAPTKTVSLKPESESTDDETEPELKQPVVSFFPPPSNDTRLPIPAAADLDTRREQIDELFPTGEAKTSQQKVALIQTLLKTGRESEDDPAAQYVLFAQAQAVASSAGNVPLAFKAIDELDERFQVAGDVLRISAIKAAASARTTSAVRSQSVSVGIKLVDRLLQQDRFVEAAKLISVLQAMTRKSPDRDQIRELVDQKKLGSELYRAYRDAHDAIERLNADPRDAAAATAAGKYFAFAKGDWQLGLPMLAAGDNEALKAIARQEMALPTGTQAQRKLADAWRQLAEGSNGIAARRQYARAAMWYRRIENQLTGLTKVAVQKHLKQIGDVGVDGGVPFRLARAEPVKPAAPADPLPGKPLDLLARIKTTRDTVRGQWGFVDDGVLFARSAPMTRIQVPFKPPPTYVLELEVTRTAGKADLAIGLVYRGIPCQVIIDGWGGTSCGITAAQRGRNVATARNAGSYLTNGRPSRIKCTVQRDRFVVDCDGREIIRHVGPPQWDSMNPGWRVPNPAQLMLGANESGFRFHSLSLTPLTPGSPPPQPSVPEAPSARGTVDLLASIDVEQHAVAGKWKRNGRTLVSPAIPHARVMIPVRPPAEYDVELEVTRTQRRGAEVAIGLIYQGRPCTVLIDRGFGNFSTLTATRRGAPVTIQHRTVRSLLPLNEKKKVTCIVRRNKLSVRVDDAEVLSFTGNATWDGVERLWNTPDANTMMLGAFVASFDIHSMRLVPVGSSATGRNSD